MKFAVYCGAASGNQSIYQEQAQALGQWLAKNNHELVYGGGNVGLMGALADACLHHGGRVTGVMPDFLIEREIAHDEISEFICVDSMSSRKQTMIDRADVCIALPGGPGTLEEIVEAISWARLGQTSNPCLFLNINGYYDGLQNFFQHMVGEGFLSQDDFSRIGFVNTIEAIPSFLD
ncbi:TIGR00730 family Rossman fold protein [Aerococcus kribbianus]|uniref:Cytokinin riboside 5'-monophosphate phosphoribohydrolase n=1 Tax=Aerococcus kribbianus TaxID=2999064 RepID=A0A9X3JFU4_9LACT|nr:MULTISPECIES: TIGR00730 family Rossman fold protein [unclassified Aerococcus]MCZ0717412.1 TIGR00730 family Rossman fold protein [Aerococcus sp. YH-aer221]MCZ0725700.1 TIGR00730 family Rossman fold protein [Aerococcus sp. YH-aer222]